MTVKEFNELSQARYIDGDMTFVMPEHIYKRGLEVGYDFEPLLGRWFVSENLPTK